VAIDGLSRALEAAKFDAPEGKLTTRIKTQRPDQDGSRVELLLWFYDQAGRPIEDNLTLVLYQSRLDHDSEGSYTRTVVAKVQEWLLGVRDGETMEIIG